MRQFLDFFSVGGYNRDMSVYRIGKFSFHDCIETDVPASKSILNRALVLAAFGKGEVFLSCGKFAEDTRAMLGCLRALRIDIREEQDGIRVFGCGGNVPDRHASLNVQSAGTAARFLTAVLAFLGGDYTMDASAQMCRRPMELLSVLSEAGVSIECAAEDGHFPFRMHSEGICGNELTVNTDLSTQYASGILLAAALSRPFTLHLTGSRTHGSYLAMTLRMLEAFGATCERREDTVFISPSPRSPARFEVEGDLSGACYFYALALLLSARVRVRRIHLPSLQGDAQFLKLLADRGVRFTDTPDGLLADGSGVDGYQGFTENMGDYSDQSLTVAALAPFASSATRITGIAHTRGQECDRIRAIAENLRTLGVPVEEHADGVTIHPAPVAGGTVTTYGDHRVAMAFSLIGLKTGTVSLDDPACCKKTFANYFEILDNLTK